MEAASAAVDDREAEAASRTRDQGCKRYVATQRDKSWWSKLGVDPRRHKLALCHLFIPFVGACLKAGCNSGRRPREADLSDHSAVKVSTLHCLEMILRISTWWHLIPRSVRPAHRRIHERCIPLMAASLAVMSVSGCGWMYATPPDYQFNRNATQAYWVDIQSKRKIPETGIVYLDYEVANESCLPATREWLGMRHNTYIITLYPFYKKISDTHVRIKIYADKVLPGNYWDNRVCHWKLRNIIFMGRHIKLSMNGKDIMAGASQEFSCFTILDYGEKFDECKAPYKFHEIQIKADHTGAKITSVIGDYYMSAQPVERRVK